ncbi:IclR family transcriptional regulator [Pseudomonas putida]
MTEDVSPTERAFLALELLAKRGSINISDLIQHLDMPKTSAHRLLSNLESFGYIRKSEGRGFKIAPRLLELSAMISIASHAQAPVHSILVGLTRATGESASFGILNGYELEYIDSATADTRLTLQFQAGQRAPLHCTSSGRVVLSLMSNRNLSKYLASGPWERFTPRTVCEADELEKIIEKTRKNGYAITDSEYTLGVIGAAVPVFTAENRLVGCVSVSAPQARKTEEDLIKAIPLMNDAARRITACLAAAEDEGL